MSNNLELGTLPEGVETPEALINSAFGAIDSLLTESYDIDLSAANAAPSAIDLRRSSFISLLGATQARDVVLPVAKRTLFLKNYGTADVTLKCGTKSIAVPAGQARTVRLTGATDGLDDIGGGGSSGDPGGGSELPTGGTDGQYLAKDGPEDGAVEWRDLPQSGGISEAPADGKQYARQDEAWTQIVASGGGSVGGGYIPVGPATLAELSTIVKSNVAVVETYADDRNFVVRRTDTGSGSVEHMAAAVMSLPASGNWQAIGVIKAPRRNRFNYTRHGLVVRRSANDRWNSIVYNQQSNDPRCQCYDHATRDNIQGGLGDIFYCDYLDFVTFRMRLLGGSYQYAVSMDFGTTWTTLYTTNENFTSMGGRPDQIGICAQAYNTFSAPNDTASPFFELTPL